MGKIIKNYIFTTSGLGNALFQLCYYHELKKKYRHVQIIKYLERPNLIGRVRGWKYHNQIIKYNDINVRYACYLDKLVLIIIGFYKHFSRDDVILRLGGSSWHFGYFQRMEIKKSYKKIIMNSVEVFSSTVTDEIVMHVRRGDFAESDRLGLDYYIRAINEIASMRSVARIVVLGVGCLELISPLQNVFPNIEFTECAATEESDFLRIWEARIVISSNSTFCFWPTVFGNSTAVVFPINCNLYKLLKNDLLEQKKYIAT